MSYIIGYLLIGLLLCGPSLETDYRADIIKEYGVKNLVQYTGVLVLWPVLLVVLWVKVTSGRYK